MKPLFIPLKTQYFNQFKNGTKQKSNDGYMTEFRKYGARWNEGTIIPGRKAIISHGYSGERMTATLVRLDIVKNTFTDLYPKGVDIAAIRLRIQKQR